MYNHHEPKALPLPERPESLEGKLQLACEVIAKQRELYGAQFTKLARLLRSGGHESYAVVAEQLRDFCALPNAEQSNLGPIISVPRRAAFFTRDELKEEIMQELKRQRGRPIAVKQLKRFIGSLRIHDRAWADAVQDLVDDRRLTRSGSGAGTMYQEVEP